MDLATSTVEMALGKIEVELGAKVAKASDEMLGGSSTPTPEQPLLKHSPCGGRARECVGQALFCLAGPF